MRASRGIHEPSAARGSSIRSMPDQPGTGYPTSFASERIALDEPTT